MPEQNVSEIRTYQAKGELKVEAKLPNATTTPAAGTGQLRRQQRRHDDRHDQAQAEFPNTDKALWPGQFANIALTLYDQANAVVTPSAAVKDGPNGPYVFVVKPDMTVELRNIKVARTEGDDTVVTSGLTPGEQVVTVGQLKLAPGTKVSVGRGAAAS